MTNYDLEVLHIRADGPRPNRDYIVVSVKRKTGNETNRSFSVSFPVLVFDKLLIADWFKVGNTRENYLYVVDNLDI